MKLFKISLIAYLALILSGFSALSEPLQFFIPAPQRQMKVSSTISPCDNYYQYVCANVVEDYQQAQRGKAPYPYYFAQQDNMDYIYSLRQAYLSRMLQTKAHPDSSRKQNIQNFYQACMDKDANKQAQHEEARRLVVELSRFQTKEALLNQIADNMASPDFSFLYPQSSQFYHHPTDNSLEFRERLLWPMYEKDFQNQTFYQDLENLASTLFQALRQPQPQKSAQTITRLQRQLAQALINTPMSKRHQAMQNQLTINTMVSKYPAFKLERFFAQIAPQSVMLVDSEPDMMAFLQNYLEQASLEELKQIYLFYSLALRLDLIYPDYGKTLDAFAKTYWNDPEALSEEENCRLTVQERFQKELDYLLWEDLPADYKATHQKDLKEMLHNLSVSLETILDNNAWYSQATRNKAIRKVRTLRMHILAPTTPTAWDLLPDMPLSPKTPLKNMDKVARAKIKQSLTEMTQGLNPRLWRESPLDREAYYMDSFNLITLTWGYTLSPFYNPQLPRSANYGGLGTTVAHEMSHAIDINGIQFDGNTQQEQPLFSPGDLQTFQRRSLPLIQIYNQAGEKGEQTLAENIADILGLRIAYQAAFPQNKGETSDKKAFFTQFARIYCEHMPEQARAIYREHDSHASNQNRVNLPLKMFPEFQATYGCKAQDPMVMTSGSPQAVW